MANKNQQTAPEVQEQVNKAEAFFEKYKKAIIICVVALILIVVGAILFNNYYLEPREDEASTELAKSQELFAQDQFPEGS